MAVAIMVLLAVSALSAVVGRDILPNVSLPIYSRATLTQVKVISGTQITSEMELYSGKSTTKPDSRYFMKTGCSGGKSVTDCMCGQSYCVVLSGTDIQKIGSAFDCMCTWEGMCICNDVTEFNIYIQCGK